MENHPEVWATSFRSVTGYHLVSESLVRGAIFLVPVMHMEEIFPQYERHVLVCTNFREEGECCAKVDGEAIFYSLKKFVLEQGLKEEIWVTRTGCLGFCNDTGTTVVVYPEKRWFRYATLADLNAIKNFLLSK